ncbi:MAG: zinc ribbon domain-containing protein [Chloroflexota bacterium]|nr:zinc ribbon domain-containing protein [Chloroflexota bacterium]
MTGMNFLDSIRKGLDRASFETDKLMRYNRVHAETARLRLEAAEKTRQLGDRVLALYKAGNLNTGDLSLLAREIVDLQTRAQQKEDEAGLIQAEVWVESLDGTGTMPVYHAPGSASAAGAGGSGNGSLYPGAPTPTPVWPTSPPPATHWTPPAAPAPSPPAPHAPPTHLEDQGTRRVADPRQPEQQEYCPNCGGPLRPHAAFCAQCGIRL